MDIKIVPEYLSKDILEEDFVNIFKAIFRLQCAMGSCRVDIKNRFVTPPTILQKCYTLLCILFTLGSMYIVITVSFGMMPDISVTSLGISVLISFFSAFFCNIVHVRFFNGRQNVEFHVKMQTLDKLMKIEKRKTLNSKLKRANVTSVFLLVLSFVFIIVLTCIKQEFAMMCYFGMIVCVMSFFLELVVGSSIIVYFYIRIRFVNFLIENYLRLDDNVRKPVIMDGVSQKCIQFAAEDTENYFTTSEIEKYLKEIFSCFAMFQDLYRFQVLK